jgi:mxaK protein
MGNRITRINLALAVSAAIGAIGVAYEGYQCWKIDHINTRLDAGQVIEDESYPYQKKFAAAYHQGKAQDYKHAVQSYSQLLEMSPSPAQQASIQYNIGNNLFLSGLQRRPNDDGSLKEETKYDFSQARIAYEQALRMAPDSQAAKFNLSLLLSVMPANMKPAPKDQSGVELSNLPIGLP